jgi:hypothetical protein
MLATYDDLYGAGALISKSPADIRKMHFENTIGERGRRGFLQGEPGYCQNCLSLTVNDLVVLDSYYCED